MSDHRDRVRLPGRGRAGPRRAEGTDARRLGLPVTARRRSRATSSGSARCSTPALCCWGAGPGSTSPGSGRPAPTTSRSKMNAMRKLVVSRSLGERRRLEATPPSSPVTWWTRWPARKATGHRGHGQRQRGRTSDGPRPGRRVPAARLPGRARQGTRLFEHGAARDLRLVSAESAGPAVLLVYSRATRLMRYALLIYEKPGAYDGLSDDERRAVSGEYWSCATTRASSAARGCSRSRPRPPSASTTARR